jgi:hypothetical protein
MAPTNVGLTEEARKVLDNIRDRLDFAEMADVRDLAVAHAIKKELDPAEEAPGNRETVWNVGSLDKELVDLLQVLYPDECDSLSKEKVFINLLHLGLRDLGEYPEFDSWSQISDLPGFSSLGEN